MKDEIEQAFASKYPKLFRDSQWIQGDRVSISVSPIYFGIECSDGWYDILAEAFEKLSKFDVVLFQVKEKFGGLRIYLTWPKPCSETEESTTEAVQQIIHEAETKACKTCEHCGKPGKLRGGSWLLTLCDECNRKRNP